MALFRGQEEVVRIILQQDNLNYSLRTKSEGYTVAHLAVMGQNVPCVEILAGQENFTCWDIPDHGGNLPIMDAIRLNSHEILGILLKCPRVDPDIKDRNGDFPVIKAIKEVKIGLAKLLINCPKVNLGITDRNGSSLQRIVR